MATTSIAINEEYLEGARRVLGTTTKVETVNQALKTVSNRGKRNELVEMLLGLTGLGWMPSKKRGGDCLPSD